MAIDISKWPLLVLMEHVDEGVSSVNSREFWRALVEHGLEVERLREEAKGIIVWLELKGQGAAAAKGNIDEAMACLRVDSYDYDDIAKLLAKESKHPMAALIAAIDLNTEIQIEKKVFEGEQQDRCMIAWRVTLAKPWSLEEHGQRISLKAGETHTLDGTVVRTGDIWLIAGI